MHQGTHVYTVQTNKAINNIYCFTPHQGFEGSIVAENFSPSDPSSNNPMMHGGLDSGGGLISFYKVSNNFIFVNNTSLVSVCMLKVR